MISQGENAQQDLEGPVMGTAASSRITLSRNYFWLSFSVGLTFVAAILNNYVNSHYLGLLVFGQFSLLYSSASYWGISGGGIGITCMKMIAQGELTLSEAIGAGAIFQGGFASITLFITMLVTIISLNDSNVVLPAILMGFTGILVAFINLPVLIYGGKNKMQGQVLNGVLALSATGMLLLLTAFPLGLLAPALAWLIPAGVICVLVYAYVILTQGLKLPERSALRIIVLQGLILTVIPLTQTVYYQLDALVVTWFSTGTALGLLSAASRLMTVIRQISWIMVMGVTPTLMVEATRGNARLNRVFGDMILWMVLAGALATVGVLAASDFIVAALYPPSFAPAALVLRVYVLAFVPMLIQWLSMNTMVAANEFKWLGIPYIVLAIVKVVGGFWLVTWLGALGVALVSLIAESLLAIIYYVWLIRSRGLEFNRRLVGFLAWIVLVYAWMIGFTELSPAVSMILGIFALIAGGYVAGGLRIMNNLRPVLLLFRSRLKEGLR